MANMIRLNQAEQANARQWIRALFNCSTVARVPQQRYGYSRLPSEPCTEIVQELIGRPCDFVKNKLDDALARLSQRDFPSGTGSGRRIRRSTTDLAVYLAWFCAQAGLIWDDSALTDYEITAIKDTLLGSTLYKAGLFVTTLLPATNTTAQSSNAQGSATKTTTIGGAPKIGYKATGAHSQHIPNLLGTANQKIMLTGTVFAIIADKTGTNTPNAYITPLGAGANGKIITVGKTAAEQVKFGSGNGYTDCMCWFDNLNDADSFCKTCQATFGNKFNNIHTVQAQADKNGYFKVSTSFGDAYIKANKLNEQLQLLEDSVDSNNSSNSSKNFQITDIELYDKWTRNSIS